MSGYKDRVAETSSTVGTGTLTLAGALNASYQSFQSAFAVGDWVYYAIFGSVGWEVGKGTLVTSTTLSRDTVYGSSNAGALVSLTGTNTIICTHPAFQHADKGLTTAMVMRNVRR